VAGAGHRQLDWERHDVIYTSEILASRASAPAVIAHMTILPSHTLDIS
jgi:hypothetical protein